MALKVGELFASFNLDTSGIDGAISSAESKMSNMGKSLMLGGAGMTAALTVPISKAASAIYSAGTEFDAEMAKVFAIAGDSVTGNVETMEALRAKALEMGSTTQFTATEAGEALEYMAMAGWKSDQMLSAIGPIMNLAAAAGADLGTTSDIVTDAMTAFGISVTDTWKTIKDGKEIDTGINNVEHFADILAAASSNANTNVTMLGESFKYAAPVAGTLGINAEDTAIALGLMANAGIKASQAGTSLRTGLTNMVKPSKQMREAMKKYGIGLVQNKDGSVNLRETMIQLRKTMSGMTETEQAAAATAIFGKHSMAGWLAIVNASDEDFNKLTDAIDGATGSAEEMKRVMLDNAKGDVTIFKSALEGLQITLWGLAEGGFRKVVQEATKYVDAFRNADKSTQLGALKMGALAAAIGPAMAGMGGLVAILPKLAKTFTLVSGPTALLAIGLLALGAAAIDSNNDIGKTFTKGMVKANIKMTQLGKTVKEQLPTLTSNMSNFLRSLSTGIKLGLPGIINGLTDILTTAVSAISANMGNIANVPQTIVTTLANSIKTNAPKIVPAVLELLTNMASALISNIPVVLEGMATVITSLVKEVQNADWGEIATKLRESLEDAIKETGTLFKKLAMGDKYTEEASWADVGMALVTNLMDGIKTGFGNLRDFVGSLLLADDYDPDEDWTTFGTKLIDKIFTGIDDATSGAESFVSGVIDGLASLFSAANLSSATTALSTIVSRIITAAADEIPKLAGHATNILSKLSEMLLGDGKSQGTAAAATEGAMKLAGAIVTSITQAIPKALDAAGNVLNAGLTLASGLLDSISDAFKTDGLDLNVGGIVQSLVDNITRAIGGVFDFGGKVVTAGAHIASSLLDSLASSLDTTINTTGVSEMTGKLKTFLQTLINKIVELVPKLFQTGGKVISAGVKLASELVKSLAEGFQSGGGIDIDLAGAAKGIVDGIVEAISNLPALLGDVLSAGAQIANSLMESISNALVDTEASGVAGTLGTALADLVKGLLNATFDFAKDSNVLGFVQNLGRGIIAALGSIGQILGSFIGELLKYLFSKEGLTKMFNAGVSLMNLLWEGMKSVVGGIVSFFTNLVDNILISWGIIDVDAKEAYDTAQDAAMSYIETAKQAYNDALTSYDYEAGTADADFQNMALLALFGARNGDMGEIVDASNQWTAEFLQIAENAINASLGDDSHISFEQWAGNMWNELDSAVQGTGEGRTISTDVVKSIMEKYLTPLGIEAGSLPDAIWESIAKNVAMGGLENGNELWSLILSSILGEGVMESPEVEGAADAATAAAEKTMQEMGVATKEAAEETKETIVTAMNDSASAVSQNGMAGAIADNTEPASEAALQLSDAVVQQFLLTMSEENGSAMAESFVGGIIAVLSSTDGVVTVAEAMGAAARDAAMYAMQWIDGYNIGHNFGLGLLRGIESMIDSVASAAAAMGNAAAGSLSESIQESSPSRLTAETGTNFGLGFINAILNSADAARNAAALMGLSANDSLTKSMSDVSLAAADQMSVTGRNGLTDSRDAESERHAMAIGAVIAEALNGARVEMNGVLVGQLVTDTVSEGIADRYSGRRYGTV